MPAFVGLTAGILWSFSPDQDGVLILGALILLCWLVFMIIKTVHALWRRRWLVSLSAMIAVAASWPVAGLISEAGDYVHLGLTYFHYKSRVDAALPNEVGQVEFDWGDRGGGNFEFHRYLVYDTNGSLAGEVGDKPARGMRGAFVNTTYLFGGFYTATYRW